MSDQHASFSTSIASAILLSVVGCTGVRGPAQSPPVVVQDIQVVVQQDLAAKIPDSPAGAIMTSWLSAHNSGDTTALVEWMRTSFSPEALTTLDFDKHLEWYVGCTTMFGKLTPLPYAIATNDEHKLVAHFLKDGVRREKTVDPTKIVVVELDLNPEQPRYLQRGLGLGELICEDRKDR